MRMPLRYTYATCSGTLTTINTGPAGARSGSQTKSPIFNFSVVGGTRLPSVKVSARAQSGNKAAAVNMKSVMSELQQEVGSCFIGLLVDWTVTALRRNFHFE